MGRQRPGETDGGVKDDGPVIYDSLVIFGGRSPGRMPPASRGRPSSSPPLRPSPSPSRTARYVTRSHRWRRVPKDRRLASPRLPGGPPSAAARPPSRQTARGLSPAPDLAAARGLPVYPPFSSAPHRLSLLLAPNPLPFFGVIPGESTNFTRVHDVIRGVKERVRSSAARSQRAADGVLFWRPPLLAALDFSQQDRGSPSPHQHPPTPTKTKGSSTAFTEPRLPTGMLLPELFLDFALSKSLNRASSRALFGAYNAGSMDFMDFDVKTSRKSIPKKVLPSPTSWTSLTSWTFFRAHT